MNQKNSSAVRRLVFIALMAVLICVCSWITIPYTIPFTMQTFAVFCALLLLGGRNGTAAIGLYVLMGLIGLPVFSGFRGGIGPLFGPTGGYIIGFIFSGIVYLLAEPLLPRHKVLRWVTLVISLAVCYLIGTLWFVVVYANQGVSYTFLKALTLCVFPYVLPDCAKLVLAVLLCDRVQRHIATK